MTKTTILLWILNQPISSYDRDESAEDRLLRLEPVASAVEKVANGDRLVAATALVQMREESGFRGDVQVCECPPKQCDLGRAHGFLQIHDRPHWPREVWPSLCGLGEGPTLRGLRIAFVGFDGDLPAWFARQGGLQHVPDWARKRAEMVRKVVREL